MKNCKKKRDRKSKRYNDNGHMSKRIKTIVNIQENDKYISSSEIKKLIRNSNLDELQNIFDISKFYDNEFIKWLLFLYKNKTFIYTIDLNKVISKDEYKIEIEYSFFHYEDRFNYSKGYRIKNSNKNLLKYLIEHEVNIDEVIYKPYEIPLIYECESGNRDLVEYLLEHGADINKKNICGITSIFKACESGNKD